MTRKHYIAIATILGRWKGMISEPVFNGIEANFSDLLTKDNNLFDDDKFIDYIDKIAKEWE